MLRKLAIALVAIAFLPMSDAMAAAKKSAKSPAACRDYARQQCPGVGTSAQACGNAAYSRCMRGK